MRILMVTLELADPVFSGNGVYGRTIVQALVSSEATTVHVLCGAPAVAAISDDSDTSPPFASHAALAAAVSDSRLQVSRVPLPVWGKVDRDSAWEAFGAGAAATIFAAGEAEQPYDMIVGVDWTSARAVAAVKQALPVPPGSAAPKVVHMNFRVFFAQLELLQGAGSEAVAGGDAAEFYTAMEHEACAQADQVVALTSADAACLAALFPSAPAPAAAIAATDGGGGSGGGADVMPPIVVLNPPLRPDIAALASDRKQQQGETQEKEKEERQPKRRRFITICARISEEKRIAEFVGTKSKICLLSNQMRKRPTRRFCPDGLFKRTIHNRI
jgi:hypothetical protein